MQSKLTRLAAELIGRRRLPGVLDYATPEPKPLTVWERFVAWVGYLGGWRMLSLLSLGVTLFVVGRLFRFGYFGWLIALIGLVLFNLALWWRRWRHSFC